MDLSVRVVLERIGLVDLLYTINISNAEGIIIATTDNFFFFLYIESIRNSYLFPVYLYGYVGDCLLISFLA